MIKKINKSHLLALEIPLNLKNILDRRALKHKHGVEDEIIALIKKGLTESEIVQEQASLFIDRVLEARLRRKTKTVAKGYALKKTK